MSRSGEPAERRVTVREALRRVLLEGPKTARELSARVGVSERDVVGHLEHLVRSVKQSGDRFEVEQAACLDCGFVFKDRARFTRPSRCPRCKSQQLSTPRFAISSRRPGGKAP
jgi:predicted Zn-ribbon and HTH transcriptional regulator